MSSETSLDNNQNQQAFQPPSKFIQASQARQAKIKESLKLQTDDDEENEPTQTDFDEVIDTQKNKKQIRKPFKEVTTKIPISVIQPKMTASLTTQRTTSKTAIEIEKLRVNREERRQRQAELMKLKEEMSDAERETLVYRQIIDAYREQPPTYSKDSEIELEPKIRVCVRKRPMNEKEMKNKHFDVVTTSTSSFPNALVTVHEPKTRVDLTKDIEHHLFSFDNLFDENASNLDVYNAAAKPLVDHLFTEGARCSFIAYGQTGSGKTHTIFGPQSSRGGDAEQGIYNYISRDIYAQLDQYNKEHGNDPLTVNACFFEIYGGRIYDLTCSKKRVTLLEDHSGNMQIQGLTIHQTLTESSLLNLINLGNQERTKGITEANPESSRSHAIFQISFVKANSPTISQTSVNIGHESGVFGKLSLIDLAGSERGADTLNVERQARIEGAEINKSLLALKECIRALAINHNKRGNAAQNNQDTEQVHVSFRGSKLTQVLRDSFIGPISRTVLIATISPGSNACEHSLNTLRYAARVKVFRTPVATHTTAKVAAKQEVEISTTQPSVPVQEKRAKSQLPRPKKREIKQTVETPEVKELPILSPKTKETIIKMQERYIAQTNKVDASIEDDQRIILANEILAETISEVSDGVSSPSPVDSDGEENLEGQAEHILASMRIEDYEVSNNQSKPGSSHMHNSNEKSSEVRSSDSHRNGQFSRLPPVLSRENTAKPNSPRNLPVCHKLPSISNPTPSSEKSVSNSSNDMMDEENALIQSHISVLNANLDIAREEETLLAQVSRNTYDISRYADSLIALLRKKMGMYQELENQIICFQKKLELQIKSERQS